MTVSTPTLEELRSVVQPDELMGRVNGEHWAGRLYMRHVSLRVTRLLVPTRVSADAVTWGMIVSGVLAALVLTVPHPLAPLGTLLAVKDYIDVVSGPAWA